MMMYFVEYNAKIMGVYKTLRGALNLCKRKPWQNDLDNVLLVYDSKGEMYNPITGAIINNL